MTGTSKQNDGISPEEHPVGNALREMYWGPRKGLFHLWRPIGGPLVLYGLAGHRGEASTPVPIDQPVGIPVPPVDAPDPGRTGWSTGIPGPVVAFIALVCAGGVVALAWWVWPTWGQLYLLPVALILSVAAVVWRLTVSLSFLY